MPPAPPPPPPSRVDHAPLTHSTTTGHRHPCSPQSCRSRSSLSHTLLCWSSSPPLQSHLISPHTPLLLVIIPPPPLQVPRRPLRRRRRRRDRPGPHPLPRRVALPGAFCGGSTNGSTPVLFAVRRVEWTGPSPLSLPQPQSGTALTTYIVGHHTAVAVSTTSVHSAHHQYYRPSHTHTQALGTSLAAMVPTALVGTYTHHTHGSRRPLRA